MSTTTTSSSASCTGNIYVMPITDSACAVPAKSNYTSIMDQCCKPASKTSYNNDCAYYCLAQEQSVGSLTDCLTDNGVQFGDVFCNANQSATATASVTSSSATSTSSSGSDSDDGDGDDNSSLGVVSQPLTKGGMGVLCLVVSSFVMGAFVV